MPLPLLAAAGIGAGLGGLGSLLSRGKNPVNNARPYLDQQANTYRDQLNPYVQRGMTAGNEAAGTFGRMANDPAAFFERLMSGYNPRKGFDEFRNHELMRQQRAAAAHGGFSGTIGDQVSQQQLLNDLLEADRDNWLDRITGIQNQGLQGQTHFADSGQNASANLAQLLGNNLGERANLEYAGQDFKNNQKMDLIRSILQGASAGSEYGQSMQMPRYNAGNYGGVPSLDAGSWNTRNMPRTPTWGGNF